MRKYLGFIYLSELPIALCSPFVLGASGHFIDGTKMFVCGFIPPKGNSYAQSLWITSAKMYFSKGKRGKKLKNSVRAASLLRVRSFSDHWRRHPDLNRGIKVLQTFALPLGYSAVYIFPRQFRKTAQIFRLKRWRLRKTRRNRNFERQNARSRSRLTAKVSFVCGNLPKHNTPFGRERDLRL